MRRTLVVLALICSALAVAFVVWMQRWDWQPHADFDVLGILWVFQNLPRIFAGAIVFLLGVAALLLFYRAATMRTQLEDEGLRMLQDPRFHGILKPHLESQEPPPPTEPERSEGADSE